jgi:outer membrane lipoprotein carrier protein LolA
MKRIVMACIASGMAFPACAAGFDIPSLFAGLARARPERVAFTEKKYLSLLDRPVESSGELLFTPPDKLEKVTLKPRPERVTVDRDVVSLERGGKKQSLRLKENPAVAVLVESIRGTLAGDLAGLSRTYSVGLQGDEGQWRLVLRPLDPSLGTLVERVEVTGTQARVATVEVHQADGDRSVMTLAPLAR